jgi:hypothetical protein
VAQARLRVPTIDPGMDVRDDPWELTRSRPGTGGNQVTDRARRALALSVSVAGSLAGALVALAVVIQGAKRW